MKPISQCLPKISPEGKIEFKDEPRKNAENVIGEPSSSEIPAPMAQNPVLALPSTKVVPKTAFDPADYAPPKPHKEIDMEFGGREFILIPEGEYAVGCLHHETGFLFGEPNLWLWYNLIDLPEGSEIFASFPIRDVIGKPGKNGRFRSKGRGSKLCETLRGLGAKDVRPSRLSLALLKNHILIAKVTTVTRKARGKGEKCTGDYYSRIGEFERILV